MLLEFLSQQEGNVDFFDSFSPFLFKVYKFVHNRLLSRILLEIWIYYIYIV